MGITQIGAEAKIKDSKWQQLFITAKDLKANTLIDGNVDVNKFLQFIKIAQQIHIQNFLGGKLYDKISADILDGAGRGAGLQDLICLY